MKTRPARGAVRGLPYGAAEGRREVPSRYQDDGFWLVGEEHGDHFLYRHATGSKTEYLHNPDGSLTLWQSEHNAQCYADQLNRQNAP